MFQTGRTQVTRDLLHKRLTLHPSELDNRAAQSLPNGQSKRLIADCYFLSISGGPVERRVMTESSNSWLTGSLHLAAVFGGRRCRVRWGRQLWRCYKTVLSASTLRTQVSSALLQRLTAFSHNLFFMEKNDSSIALLSKKIVNRPELL